MYPRFAWLALFVAGSGLAQTAPELEPVLVTATRFPDSTFKAPAGARIISAEDISHSGANNIAEALNKLGGVHVRQDLFGGSNPSIDLRGFGVTGDQNTLLLVDGVRISENELSSARLSGISLDSVDRIEILPSGGAVLYGGNATGGVINIITRQGRPDHRAGRVALGVGNFDTRNVRGSASIGGEQISFRMNAQDYRSDNERRNNRVELQNVGGTLALHLHDTELALNFGGERNRSRLPGARSEAQWHSDPRGTSTPNDYGNTDQWHAGLAALHRLGEFELAANLTRRERKTEFFNDFGFGFFNNDHRQVISDEFSPRIKWSSRLAGLANEMVAGFDWRDWDFESKTQDAGGNSLEEGRQRSTAWYVQDSLLLTSTTLLTLGGRTEAVDIDRAVPYATAFGMAIVDQHMDKRLNAWSAGIKQTLGGGWSAHLRTGTSYRVANIDENRCWAQPCTLLRPQTSRDHEVGVAWATQKVSGSAVVFRSDLENELYFNRLSGFFGANINMPPTRRQGIELAGHWEATSTLALRARYTWTDATFRSGVFSGIDVTGNKVPVVPRHRANLLANWQITGDDRLHVGVNYVGRQQYDNDPANRFAKMPAYTTVDAKYSHRIGAATLSLAANNLFDRKYYSYALVNSPTSPTTFNAYPDLTRTLMATVDYQFD